MNRQIRTLLVLVVALAAAGVASFAVYRAVQRVPVRQVEIATQSVVVAAKALPVGVILGPDDVRLIAWPTKSPIAGGLAKIQDAVGRGLLNAVSENEPITETKLAPREAGGGLPPTIPQGMRALSVKVDEVVGVAGFAVPGTHVDVLATVTENNDSRTRTVVSNIQVLTAGTRYDQQEAKNGKPIPTTVVTLLVTPDDAEKIAMAAQGGKVMLALRNPMDTVPTATQGVRLATLIGPPAPPPVVRTVEGRKVVRSVPAPEMPPAPRPYVVETIRAAKRTEEVIK
jgi:pilus assembly protein CpaB